MTLKKLNKAEILRQIDDLKKMSLKVLPVLKRKVGFEFSPDLVFLVGNGYFDGHGILVKDKAWVFFDMLKMNIWLKKEGFAVKTHFAHETLHAIHYYYSPEFYIGNYVTVKDRYLKRMIAEGMGTYISGKAMNTGENIALWLGFFNKEEVEIWRKNCINIKRKIWHEILQSIEANQFSQDLDIRLFSAYDITKEALLKGRVGYYFGMNIVKLAGFEVGISKLVHLDFSDFESIIKHYFEDIVDY